MVRRLPGRLGTETFRGMAGQLLTINRAWQPGDLVQIKCSMGLRVEPNAHQGSERVTVHRGPQVLAADDKLDTFNALPGGWIGDQFYRLGGQADGKKKLLRLVPFAARARPVATTRCCTRLPGSSTPSELFSEDALRERP